VLALSREAGSFSSIEPVLGALERNKRKQIAAASEAKLPLVMVIGSANSDIKYGVYSMSGAMFGQPQIRLRVGPDDPDPDPQNVFGPGGKVQPQQFRGVSALAGIRRFNPTEWRLEAAARTRGLAPDRHIKSRRLQIDWFRRRMELRQELTERGIFDPSAALARMVVLHNHYAHRPVDPGMFGLYDEHHGVIEMIGGAEWTHVASGRLANLVPKAADA
jgi:hypothetical protein